MTEQRYNVGLIAGKFYPPHLGHQYLINTAESLCRQVVVFVVYKPGENPDVRYRLSWINNLFPDYSKIQFVPVIDIETDDSTPESNVEWAKYTRDIFRTQNWDSSCIDAVFSSEQYAVGWAKCLGAEHVMVDRSRTAYPISGTAVRNDPYANWSFLPPEVRGYYTKRIAIVGPEATGKTTLARLLAEHYNTVWVPEYGRLRVEQNDVSQVVNRRIVFPLIAYQQQYMEDDLANQSNRVLLCDTELITTEIWYRVWQPDRVGDSLHQSIIEQAQNRHYDLYLLSVPNGTSWRDDGIQDQKYTREWFMWEYRKKLAEHGDPVVELHGDWQERFLNAVVSINRLFSEGESAWQPPDLFRMV